MGDIHDAPGERDGCLWTNLLRFFLIYSVY